MKYLKLICDPPLDPKYEIIFMNFESEIHNFCDLEQAFNDARYVYNPCSSYVIHACIKEANKITFTCPTDFNDYRNVCIQYYNLDLFDIGGRVNENYQPSISFEGDPPLCRILNVVGIEDDTGDFKHYFNLRWNGQYKDDVSFRFYFGYLKR